MAMMKHDPKMVEFLLGLDANTPKVQHTLVTGIGQTDDGPPPAVIVIHRTGEGAMSALVLVSSTEVSEFASSLLQASREVFDTDEHEESKEKPSN